MTEALPSSDKVPDALLDESVLRPAATVLLLRDAAEGLQVFMVRRHAQSADLGGVYVFPGGKVDEADGRLAQAQLDLSAADMLQRLGEPALAAEQAVALHVAAARELWEECGVLLAAPVAPVGQPMAEAAAPAPGHASPGAFDETLRLRGLRLQCSALRPWTRWITPRVPAMMSRRFDTRFFVAALPGSQHAVHDGHEATDSAWFTPAQALAAYHAGQIALAPPQIMSLLHLGIHQRVQQVLDEAGQRLPPVIEPESFDDGGGRVVVYPGDERHSVRQRAWPVSTRLVVRAGRFHVPEAPGSGG